VIAAWLNRRHRWIQSSVLGLIVVTIFAWIGVGLFGAFIWSNRGPFAIVKVLLAIGAAFAAPHLIVAVSVCWSVVLLAKWALVPRWVSAPRNPLRARKGRDVRLLPGVRHQRLAARFHAA